MVRGQRYPDRCHHARHASLTQVNGYNRAWVRRRHAERVNAKKQSFRLGFKWMKIRKRTSQNKLWCYSCTITEQVLSKRRERKMRGKGVGEAAAMEGVCIKTYCRESMYVTAEGVQCSCQVIIKRKYTRARGYKRVLEVKMKERIQHRDHKIQEYTKIEITATRANKFSRDCLVTWSLGVSFTWTQSTYIQEPTKGGMSPADRLD